MSRRRFLIAYDISDDVRLRRVCKIMKAFGERLQYSVFLCDLNPLELARWRAELLPNVNLSHDSVVCIDLGPESAPAAMSVYGVPRRTPRSGSTIV